MIVIYLDSHQPTKDYNDKLKQIEFMFEAYHFGDTQIITERNPTVIIDILRFYKPYQFITYSLNEFDSTPTMISELILTMVDKLDITFNTIKENIHLDKNNFLSIYPTIFEFFRDKIIENQS